MPWAEGPYTAAEQLELAGLLPNRRDALARLLPAMLPHIDLPRALLRGRYMRAVAQMETTGTPIDTDTLARLLKNWERIKGKLIAAVNRDYGVFVSVGHATIDQQSRFGAAVLSVRQ